ncbi:Arc family DNA-binding protein [Komagataeibacter oboediens]|uniref:Arc family DNA-binding protein n=1 Tax=Komagataeibacter oboediens TaxID=65958 RepID=UPI001C2BB912|nr:Arc family DNA-binding protein [Komagataeibacter oboediens]MBV0890010.1 Arc family DNA-binding protein [Komagataeibacter oboediens]MCK9818612.1 Arc family DNA-binding protein [Komagataeibacter oboediens]
MTDERRVPITLRMPRDLLDRLKAAADAHSHSMNAEIVQRLEASLNDQSLADNKRLSDDLSVARVNVVLCTDALEHAEELAEYEDESSEATEITKALALHDVKRAKAELERARHRLAFLEEQDKKKHQK